MFVLPSVFVISFLDNRGHKRITADFSRCTLSELSESPQGLMLFFSESGFTGMTIGLFSCMVFGPFSA